LKKRTKKLLYVWIRDGQSASVSQRAKVFCFFFSKKKYFFASRGHRQPRGLVMQESAQMSEVELKSIVPILFVRDVSTSAAFFREKLGFEFDFLYGTPPFYGSVSRGEARLHLRFVQQPNFAELAAREVSLILASIEVTDVHALFEEFKQRGVEFGQVPTKQSWGGTDFHVRDPDRNMISFVMYDRPRMKN
jgi:catechol 2,3-dioxygenase-like lactoylglutathione lyase family enzyme